VHGPDQIIKHLAKLVALAANNSMTLRELLA
jgi:hypothetical protein